MKVAKSMVVTIKDSEDSSIFPGDQVLYRGSAGRDYLGIFRDFAEGLIQFENKSNQETYNVRIGTIEWSKKL